MQVLIQRRYRPSYQDRSPGDSTRGEASGLGVDPARNSSRTAHQAFSPKFVASAVHDDELNHKIRTHTHWVVTKTQQETGKGATASEFEASFVSSLPVPSSRYEEGSMAENRHPECMVCLSRSTFPTMRR